MASKEADQVAVIMVPFPLQGHLNEILHLSCLLTSYHEILSVHYAGSSTHNQQAKLRIQGWRHPENNPSKIHFHDFQLPPFPLIPPNPSSSIKFPAHLEPVFDASLNLRQPVSRLLQELSTKFRKIIVIHDTLMASVVQDVKSIQNSESFALQSVSAFTIFCYIWDQTRASSHENDSQLDPDIRQKIPSTADCFTPEFARFIANEYKTLNFDSGRLFNTSRVIEGRYMELLAKMPMYENKKLFAIGPFNPVEVKKNSRNIDSNNCRHRCLEWLDKQERNSVIYVSFGSTVSFTDEQIRELAIGLERSEQKFIWVLRSADTGDIFSENEPKDQPKLPEGYEERVEDMGMVVRDWAPQLEILAHESTGGFISHCGWNSCMESISMGVSIAAWPMHSDQPRNAVLLTEVLKIGLTVRDWESRAKLVRSETIENVVRRLMTSNEGKEIRERAVKIGEKVRGSVAKGGASQVEMDSFIAYINR